MDHLDKEVIESLSEPAKRVFKSLDSFQTANVKESQRNG